MTNELRDMQKKMTIYASDNVLKAWADFKEVCTAGVKIKEGKPKIEQMDYVIHNEAPSIERLILAIRKELGYKNKNIKQYDILRLYINDIKKYIG